MTGVASTEYIVGLALPRCRDPLDPLPAIANTA
jgi:hypothetical protein